jgi:HSP20 family protein
MKLLNVKPAFIDFPRMSDAIEQILQGDRMWKPEEFLQRTAPVNILESEEEFLIELSAPGLKKELFKIALEDQLLSISLELPQENEAEAKQYRRREFKPLNFKKSLSLPKSVLTEQISAAYENGILKLHIPKAEEARSKGKIEIEVA